MPDPLENLPPSSNPAPILAPVPARETLVCEFCECRLTPKGHALELSPKAKRWRDHSDDLEKLTTKIAALEETIREKDRRIAELAPKAKHSIFD